MKLGPVTKLDKKNSAMSKKFDDVVMLANCGIIAFFPIYGQFPAIWKPDSKSMVYETYIFSKNNILSYKNLKQPKNL